MANKGSFVWTIDRNTSKTKPNAFKLFSCQMGDEFRSEVFEIANLKWQILCYPNGRDEEEEGCFIAGFELLNMPDQWKEITLQCRLEVPQTKTSLTHVATLGSEVGLWRAWNVNYLLLHEAQDAYLNTHQKIQIKVSIKIIEIVAKKHDLVLFHHASPTLHYSIKSGSLLWTMNDDLLGDIALARPEKPYESQLDIIRKDPLIMMRSIVYNGRIAFGLRIVNVPFKGISSMKVKWRMQCKENESLSGSGVDKVHLHEYLRSGQCWSFKVCKFKKDEDTMTSEFDSDLIRQYCSLSLAYLFCVRRMT